MRHLTVVCVLLCVLGMRAGANEPRRTENVIIVTLDGFRWQELFTGADETLLDAKTGGVKDLPGLKRRYWRDTARERREALLPFFWGTIGKQGQIFGDPTRKAASRSINGLKFSYPGYNEIFCGFADARITSNAKKDNPNLSVLEFLNDKPAFKDRVVAFCTWDVFPFIFRASRNGLKVHAGWTPIQDKQLSERERHANELMVELPRYWPDNAFDVFTMIGAREHLRRHKPRVLYIGLGESDEWGHGRRYDLYLDSVQKADRYLADVWKMIQEMPEYKNKTALILTTDHGRGLTRVDWTDHGKKVVGAEYIWIAVMGPDTPARGVRREVETTQAQVAATIAALLGEDFNAVSPQAAPPLPGIFDASDTPPYHVDKPLPEPVLFGDGVVSTGDYDSHPAFTPDGRTLYFVKSTPAFTDWTIYVSHYLKGRWSAPKVAPFSGKHRDADPFITADGKQLYFISDRPVDGKPREDMDIWVMERTKDGAWGEPRNLGAPVNSAASEWFPTVAANGTLYFGSDRGGGRGKTDLYRARRADGKFAQPENLGAAVNSAADEYEGCIAADESFLVFMAAGRPDSLGGGDLYISYQKDGQWTPAKNLGPKINGPALEISPYLSPDGKYFFFSSARKAGDIPPGKRPSRARNGLGDIYQMDLSALHELTK